MKVNKKEHQQIIKNIPKKSISTSNLNCLKIICKGGLEHKPVFELPIPVCRLDPGYMCPLTSKIILHGTIPCHLLRIFSKWIYGHFYCSVIQKLNFEKVYCWVSHIDTFARLQMPVKVAFCETQWKSKVEDPWSC